MIKNKTTHTHHEGTLTAIGFIPHYQHNGIELPVKLDFAALKITKAEKDNFALPKQNGYDFVYVLPGGNEYAPPA